MVSSEGLSTSSLVELVGLATEAAVQPEQWNGFLEKLEDHFPGSRITLFGHEDGRPSSALSFCRNFPLEYQQAYAEHYVRTSPYVLRGLERLSVGRARLSEDVISMQELETTEYYNDFIRPRGLGCYAAGVIIERSPQRMVALSLVDHDDDPERRTRQLQLLDLLTPHVSRAFRLHTVLDRERRQSRAALGVFQTWAHAAVVLAGDGRLVTMNEAAEDIVASRDGVMLARDGRLRSLVDSVNARLDKAVFNCAHHLQADGLALPRVNASPLNAMIAPLPYGADPDGGPGAVLVILVDPDRPHRAPIDWIARRFGLAPAEARLAELLVNGESLAEAAAALDIKLSTARTRLKAVQAKTECHRQADLTRLAMSAPPLRA
ncbi:helix-turn-helix transcriptional regulator [Caulobacter mirabilis]|uniref:helix-turn-helix transcriptional regulator n=1 Tax=Caulobacter mirabilis TaxID=69666 RepID=UPI0012373235|nr:hypothetical protein [Caulobacter mirabilis]